MHVRLCVFTTTSDLNSIYIPPCHNDILQEGGTSAEYVNS